MLNDGSTYKLLATDPTKEIERKNNSLIKGWVDENMITSSTGKSLKINNSVPPKIYFLPKIHKTGVPLRPIVSNIGSPTYRLAKYCSQSLTQVVGKTQYHTKDSWSFAESIRGLRLPENHKLISLDVTSLFTNVPIELALQCIEDRWNEIEPHTLLPKDEFCKGVRLCLESTYFVHRGQFFKQIEGVAMGSPISPIVANLVMEKLESDVISKLGYQLPFFKRYVDDILTAVHVDHLTDIVDSFNSFHPKLQFTREIEVDNKISFLDLSVVNMDGTLNIDWYQKPTWSGRYLQYSSHHPSVHKKCVVSGLFDRGLKLSEPILRKKNIKLITDTLCQNGYPINLINDIKASRVNILYNGWTYQQLKESRSINNPYRNFTVLPYVKGLAEQISKFLRKYGVRVVYKVMNTTARVFSHLKDPVPTLDLSDLVYKIDCLNCNKCYIGQIKQHLSKRIYNHTYSIECKDSSKSALSNHALSLNHKFDFDNTTVIAKESNEYRRLIKEMTNISRHTTCNKRTDIEKLSSLYAPLLLS